MAAMCRRLLGACLALQVLHASGDEGDTGDSCAAGGCAAEVATSKVAKRQHYWPFQKGFGQRTGYSQYVMPDISKGPSWTAQETFGDVTRATPLIDDQKNIYVTTVAGRTYKFNVDGKVLWTYYTDSKGTLPGVGSLSDSLLVFTTRKGFVIALDLETGEEVWVRKITEQVATACDCNLITDNLVIVSITDPVPLKQLADPLAQFQSDNNRVVALSMEDGSVRWTFTPYRPTFNFQASTTHDGSFVFQDYSGGVYRLTTSEGKLMWYTPAPDRESGTTAAAVIHDGRVFAVSNIGGGPQLDGDDGKGILHVYDYKDGRFLWSQDLPYEGNQAVAVGEIAGFPGKPSLILGMGKNPGIPIIARLAMRWGAALVPLLFPVHLLSIHFPSLFSSPQGRSIVALDAASGNVLWYYELEPYRKPAAAGDSERLGDRFQGMANGSNPNNEPWCLPDANAQPAIDGAGTAFVPFQDGKLYAVRDENGDGKITPNEVKEHFVGGAFQAAPGMAPGLLAVVDCNGRLEVFRDP